MIKNYLEDNREDLFKRKVELEKEEHQLDIKIRENVEFINFLYEEEESDYESFTPRNSHPQHSGRIKELKEQQEELRNKKEIIIRKKEELEKEISEISDVIKDYNSNENIKNSNNSELEEILQQVIKCRNLINTDIKKSKEELEIIEKRLRNIIK